jgi:transposase
VAKNQRRRKLEICHPDAAGIDIGSRSHWVAVPEDRDDLCVREFGTFTADLHALADWLKACGLTTVAMESTGVYWLPVYEVLEAEGFEVVLVNGKHVRNVPGRKSDVKDCQWIQELHSYGLLRGSFRPAAEIAELRTYARHRQTIVEGAARHIQHMQKALMQMNIQIQHALSDITGVTGQRIIRALAAGQYDPLELAKHRDPRCHASEQTIAKALTGNYKPEHIFELQQALSLYDAYQHHLAECDRRMQEKLDALAKLCTDPQAPRPKAKRAGRNTGNAPDFDIHGPLYRITNGVDLTDVPGVASLTALNFIAEVGTDMARWPTAKNFASWLNLAPGTTKTGGKLKTGRRPYAKNRAGQLLRQTAVAAGRTATAIGAFYRRLAARSTKAVAVVATAHKIAVAMYHMLKHGRPYRDVGSARYEEAYRQRRLRSLRQQAKALGFDLNPLPLPAAP